MAADSPSSFQSLDFVNFPIVQVQFEDGTCSAVDAEDLHTSLMIGTDCRKWIARRIQENDLQFGRDYAFQLPSLSASLRTGAGRPKRQFMLRISVALEIVAHTANSQTVQVRKYILTQAALAEKALPIPAQHPPARSMPSIKPPPEKPRPDVNLQPIQVAEGIIGGVKCLVVDARALHKKLGVGRDFTTWIKKRLDQFEFEPGIDYEVADLGSPNLVNQKSTSEGPPNLKVGRGGDRRSKTYSLSLETGKHLAMAERTEAGRQVRRYFIECERKLLNETPKIPAAARLPLNPTIDEIYAANCMPDSEVLMMTELTKARFARCWLLAMRFFGTVHLQSRDTMASEQVACAYQSRISAELWSEILKQDDKESIFTPSGNQKAHALIASWSPSAQ